MNIKDYTKIEHKRYSNNIKDNDDKLVKYLKFLITRVLISIILVIGCLIMVRLNDNNRELLDKYVFKDSLKFTQINKWYQDTFGKILPTYKQNSELVFSDSDVTMSKYEKYKDGIKISTNKNTPVSSMYGGIIVFIGEKDGYGNTLVIQGNDGINYYYGGITNTNLNLFDYIEKDTLIGETSDEYLYIILEKDGKYIDYDEYIKEI